MKANVPSGHTITAARASGRIASTPRARRWMTTQAKIVRTTAEMAYGYLRIRRFMSRDPDDGRHVVAALQDGQAGQVGAKDQVEPASRCRHPVLCHLARRLRLEEHVDRA